MKNDRTYLGAVADTWRERLSAKDDWIERLTKLVKAAYTEGFTEDMREHYASSGGKPWRESRSFQCLAALSQHEPNDDE